MIDNPLVVFRIPAPDDHSDDRILYLGDDQTGRPLEVMTVPVADGDLVIHAMDLRAKCRFVYDAANEATIEMTTKTPDDADYDPGADDLLYDT